MLTEVEVGRTSITSCTITPQTSAITATTIASSSGVLACGIITSTDGSAAGKHGSLLSHARQERPIVEAN